MKTVILDLEGLEDLSLAPLKEHCTRLTTYQGTNPEDLVKRAAEAEVLIVNKVVLGKNDLSQCKNLRMVQALGTGTDNIDHAACQELGITVCNCQAYGTASVVQHVFALILALQTNLLSYHQAVRAGRWPQASQFCFLDYPIAELKGLTLGIIGYGTLGKGVARVAEAFGMEILICRRPGGITDDRLPLDQFLPKVDILSLHCPLTEATRNIIGRKALAMMKPSALLINTARGGLVDEEALVEALTAKTIGGAAVDVLSSEPPPGDHPLLNCDLANLIVTPHIAWASLEARKTILCQVAENIKAMGENAPIRVV